jgi:hypothetical protein
MPLNDEVVALLGNKFTADQILEQLLPDAQTKLTANGHVIRKKEDDDSYVASKAKELKDAEIGTHVGTLHQFYEDQITDLGYTKKSNEKTSDFQKRVLSELKLKADAATGGDSVLKQQIETLTANLDKATSDAATQATDLKNKFFKKQVDSELSGELNKIAIAIPTTIKTDAEKQAYAENQRKLLKLQLLNDYTAKEDNDGNVLFYKGEILEKSTINGAPLTANDIIKRDFSAYMDVTAAKGGGAGSSASGTSAGTFQTRQEVYDHLKTSGYEEGTNKFTQAAVKIIKEQGIIK